MNIYTKLTVVALLAAAVYQVNAVINYRDYYGMGVDGDRDRAEPILLGEAAINKLILQIKLTNKTGALAPEYANYWKDPIVEGNLKFIERSDTSPLGTFSGWDTAPKAGGAATNIYNFMPTGVGDATIKFISTKGDQKIFTVKIGALN